MSLSVTFGMSAVWLGVVEASGPVANDGELFAGMHVGLLRFAAAVRPVGIDPEDLVQEALARALAIRPLSELEEPATYLRTVMVRIASNLQRGRRRTNSRLARVDSKSETLDDYPSDLADLMRLAPRARAILYLTVIEGEHYRAAAAVVGCSEAAARAIASRAQRELRRQLTDELDSKEPT
jgi:RNA polymerase sigma factor (sigma-70 family)